MTGVSDVPSVDVTAFAPVPRRRRWVQRHSPAATVHDPDPVAGAERRDAPRARDGPPNHGACATSRGTAAKFAASPARTSKPFVIRPFERWRSPSRAAWGTPLTNRRAGWVRLMRSLMRSRRSRRSSRKSSRRSGNSLFPAEGDRRLGPEALGTSPQRAEAACRASGMRVAGPIGVRKTRTVLRNTRATAA